MYLIAADDDGDDDYDSTAVVVVVKCVVIRISIVHDLLFADDECSSPCHVCYKAGILFLYSHAQTSTPLVTAAAAAATAATAAILLV